MSSSVINEEESHEYCCGLWFCNDSQYSVWLFSTREHYVWRHHRAQDIKSWWFSCWVLMSLRSMVRYGSIYLDAFWCPDMIPPLLTQVGTSACESSMTYLLTEMTFPAVWNIYGHAEPSEAGEFKLWKLRVVSSAACGNGFSTMLQWNCVYQEHVLLSVVGVWASCGCQLCLCFLATHGCN